MAGFKLVASGLERRALDFGLLGVQDVVSARVRIPCPHTSLHIFGKNEGSEGFRVEG